MTRLDKLDTAAQDSLRVDLVFASGGLHYLDEITLRCFFEESATLTRYLLLAQPLAIDFLMQNHLTSLPRGNLSWSHPYLRYLDDAGWVDISYKVGFVEHQYWAKNVGVYAHSTGAG